jgi:hypothetical protein
MENRTMTESGPDVLVGIMHNGDAKRLQETKGALSKFFGPELDQSLVLTLESQPEFVPPKRLFALKRLMYVFSIEFKNQARIKTPKIRYLRLLALFLVDLMRLFGSSWAKTQRRIYSESALTEKHISAMAGLSQSDRDFLLAVEDDIYFSENSGVDLQSTKSVLSTAGTRTVYLSLSVAFSLGQLGVEKIAKEKDGHLIELSAGIANTTAAYVINRKFAQEALELIRSNPRFRWLPADWLFTELQRHLQNHLCLHAKAGPFINGSLFGLTRSEIRP